MIQAHARSIKAWMAVAAAALLSACAVQPQSVSSIPAISAEQRANADWAFDYSDVPVDPDFRFGKLDSGLRYVIRQNATPIGTAIVRMEISAGSIDENDDELGFAHFVEHMAFNGSTNVPEGEMVRLLERVGLAFGADTNAATSFERTTYKLNLPRNDPDLLDTALMLMRETASELTMSPDAVDRERGVVLSELQYRNSFTRRNSRDSAHFLHPAARYPNRFPIGTVESLNAATSESLKAFWAREYVPDNTTIIIIGDFDPDLIESIIRKHFSSWIGAEAKPQPAAGPVNSDDVGRTRIYIDPALSERVSASRHGPWLDEPDSIAQRQENLLRGIGYAIINRRLERLSLSDAPPFRDAGYGTGAIFESGRTTRLIVDTVDRKWQSGLTAGAMEYRRALKFGFSEADIAEQVANIRRSAQNGAASAGTRSHRALENVIWGLVREDMVPSAPSSVLERFNAFAPQISPDRVLEAMKREAVPLTDPLLRFRGRIAPEGGENALRAAWDKAMLQRVDNSSQQQATEFAYTQFGTPGVVVSDAVEPALNIRTIQFDNGVMLNLRRTEIEQDKVRIRVSIDGGDKLETRKNPLATAMISHFVTGGLGQHSRSDLATILAGRNVDSDLSSWTDTFVSTATTTPKDLELQLQLLAAFVSDPGYRQEGETRYRQYINNYFAQLGATPISALRGEIGRIVSDGDPRFTLQPVEQYRKLTFDRLKQDISEALQSGAIEIGIVGDFDEDAAISHVAKTYGALPTRKLAFSAFTDLPARTFTADRSPRIVRHSGPADQAMLRLAWPTRDDSDPVETLGLELLKRIVKIEMTETLREALGKTYSPGAANSQSRYWPGYGSFGIAASIDVGDVAVTRAAILESVRRLGQNPVSADKLQRARQPMIEQHQNALKSNSGWLSLVDRAQSEADRIDRYLRVQERLLAITPEDIQRTVQTYLDPDTALEILVLPENIEVSAD